MKFNRNTSIITTFFIIVFLLILSGCSRNISISENSNTSEPECSVNEDCALTTFQDKACCDSPSYLPISKKNKGKI